MIRDRPSILRVPVRQTPEEAPWRKTAWMARPGSAASVTGLGSHGPNCISTGMAGYNGRRRRAASSGTDSASFASAAVTTSVER
jgi:hypothetical protein